MGDGKLGIMGGTFDPIHFGHLVAAEEARIRFGLDQVIFVPAGQPSHKKPYPVTDHEHRYVMTVLATCSNLHFTVSRIELERAGPTYTIDTLRQFRHEHGAGVQFYFITGADAILDILTWRDSSELVGLCEFIAATRPGYDLSGLERALSPELRGHVHPLTIPGIEISSTEIRQRTSGGLPIKYLTPPEVEAYIRKYHLYRHDA